MMGYVDGELTPDERRELLAHCRADPELARELAEYKRLAQISNAMKLAEPIDDAVRRLAGHRGYRLVRAVGSVIAVLGFVALGAGLALDAFSSAPPRLISGGLVTLVAGVILFSGAELWARKRLLALDEFGGIRR